MRKPIFLTSLALAALLLTGCQTWLPGGTAVTTKKGDVTLTPPSGWMYATTLGPDLLASKDGLVLQNLVVEHIDVTKPLKESKRTLSAAMSPFEAAEAILGELRANQALSSFELKENSPATVGGKPGFKLVFSYRTKDKLHLTEARYGTLVGQNLWLVRYAAPARHYFDRDLQDFENAVKTLQFGKST